MNFTTYSMLASMLLLTGRINAFDPSLRIQRAAPAVNPSTTSLQYTSDDVDASVAKSKPQTVKPATSIRTTKLVKGKKATIQRIDSLDDLQLFLDDDTSRFSAIKFYAPWCKSCQKLGRHYDRLAMEIGDGILDRQKVKGEVRFAAVEYGSSTAAFIQEQLKVDAVPTMQLYRGRSKLWQISGQTDTRQLKKELSKLQLMEDEALEKYMLEVDDGILEDAIEESAFGSLDFLNEEW